MTSHQSAKLGPQIDGRDCGGGKVPLSEQRLPDEKTCSVFNGSAAAITELSPRVRCMAGRGGLEPSVPLTAPADT